MPSARWTILIIGDLFVTHEMFRKAIERHLAKIPDGVRYKVVETYWPDDPLKDVEEVQEGVGDVDAMICEMKDVDIIVTDYGVVTKRMIDAAPKLKLIAVSRGGPVSVNVKAAHERGIEVVNLPGRNSRAVAEFTLGLIFAQMKQISESHCDMKRGVWRGDFYRFDKAPREFSDQIVGLIGLGSVGQLLAPMLKCLGMKVQAVDPYVTPHVFEILGVQSADLSTVLELSDVVSLHARVSRDNIGMIGENQLRRMKRSAYLVNTARAALVDYSALYRALKQGWIAGAALDIYDTEPIDQNYPLVSLNNVVLTPHIAGSSKETAIRSADQIGQEIRRFINNEPLVHSVRTA
jgi:D-3-phosphoglycerate dehydrogenase